MEPKLKVFLSSSQYEAEFLVEREVLPLVFDAEPLKSGFVLWRIEDYASPEPPETTYLSHVDDCDIYLLLLAKTLRPAVVKEYHRAVKMKKPVFALLRRCENRDPETDSFIGSELKTKVTWSEFGHPRELREKITNSLFQYFLRIRPERIPEGLREKPRSIASPMTEEERALRILAGILPSSAADLTKKRVIEAAITSCLATVQSPVTDQKLGILISRTFKLDDKAIREDVIACLRELQQSGEVVSTAGGFTLSGEHREAMGLSLSVLREKEGAMLQTFYAKHKGQLPPGITFLDYSSIVREASAKVIYHSALAMAESEYGKNQDAFPYDSEEISRAVSFALSQFEDLPGGIACWQPIVVQFIASEDPDVIQWMKRVRRGYWCLAVLGMDPACVACKVEHIKSFEIYLDSHIALRAMVGAGSEQPLCKSIVTLGGRLGVKMRISAPIFEEIQHAFGSADRIYRSSGNNIIRAVKLFQDLGSRSDILHGYLSECKSNPNLTWEAFLNRYYSPISRKKLENYLEAEMGITLQRAQELTSEQWGEIEDIAEKLLRRRGQPTAPSDLVSSDSAKWHRTHLLRTNEAKQMAMIYQLRSIEATGREFWFVTLDSYIYRVSTQLARSGNSFYEFPCYIKPGRWLEMMVNMSDTPLPINVFNQLMISEAVQQIADAVEAEVISEMLESRVDEQIKDLKTLRFMFADIVNRPAVQDAYEELLRTKGARALKAGEAVKDAIISSFREELAAYKTRVSGLSSEIELERRAREKEQRRTRYYKAQLGTLTSKMAKEGKKKKKVKKKK